jgi:hypothetical protein
MQPITCEACRQPTPAHDVVNYGSMEGGYRQLCGRCFNEAAASRLGLQGFEHVVFEPVRMVDGRGAEHEFRFRTWLFGHRRGDRRVRTARWQPGRISSFR